jgi:hypothetical protein
MEGAEVTLHDQMRLLAGGENLAEAVRRMVPIQGFPAVPPREFGKIGDYGEKCSKISLEL